MTYPAGDRASAASLEREADALDKRLDDVLAAQSVGRWMLLIPVLLILGIFGIWAIKLVSTLRANFAQDRVQAALTEQAKTLAPELQRRVSTAMENAFPVYRDALVQRVREAGPGIAEQALERFKTVPKENGDILAAQLQGLVDRVSAQIEPDVQKNFPDLDQTQMAQLLTEFRDGQLKEQTERLRDHVGEAITNELITLDQILTKFDVKASDFQDVEELKRGFIINLLDYAKLLVEQGGSGSDVREIFLPGLKMPAPEQPAAQ